MIRSLSCFSLFTVLAIASPVSAENSPLVLTDFDEEDVAEGWVTVNDNVMGGRSKGGPEFAGGRLVFTGSTNTNGGGFSSIRTVPGSYDLGDCEGLLFRVRGDGRTYRADLRTDVSNGRVAYRTEFETVAGEWIEVFVPFSEFTASMWGQDMSDRVPKLDPAAVTCFGFMIYDGKDGDFSLEIEWVKAGDLDEQGKE